MLGAAVKYKVWAEICADRMIHNLELARSMISPGKKIMAVVKADAYGFGAVNAARLLLSAGADCLAVANVDEGIVLRVNDIMAPILILGGTPIEQAEDLINYRLTPSLSDLPLARCLNQIGRERNEKIKIHLRVDTGMGSTGVLSRDCSSLATALGELEYLEIEGLYTHLNAAYDLDKKGVREQLGEFQYVLNELSQAGMKIPLVHAASSPALGISGTEFDMIRPGIMLYGLPSQNYLIDERVFPVMSLKARISGIKEVGANFRLGYGWTLSTSRPTRIATLPLGYADAFFLYYLQGGEVLLHGQRAPIIGRACMDHFMIDITHIAGVKIGDEAVLLGEQGEDQILAADIAARAGIGPDNYDLVCLLGPRIPRIYT